MACSPLAESIRSREATVGCCCNYLLYDIGEAGLGCSEIDVLFQVVGKQRGTLMLVDWIGVSGCWGNQTESLPAWIELFLSQIERGIEAEPASDRKYNFQITWKNQSIGFACTFQPD